MAQSTQSLTLRVDNEGGCAGSGPREVTGEVVTHQCRGFLETCLGPLLHRYAASSMLSPIGDAQTLNDDIAFFCPRRSLKMTQGMKFSTKRQRSCTRLGPQLRCGRRSFRRSRERRGHGVEVGVACGPGRCSHKYVCNIKREIVQLHRLLIVVIGLKYGRISKIYICPSVLIQ